jgi:phosphomannomutase/phosphoglucomutase
VKKIYKKLPFNVEFINMENDPSFPNHQPDPSMEDNMKQLRKEVLDSGADLGIAYDGDGDRVGIVDNKGKVIPADKLIGIMAPYILKENPDKPILYDIKCSNMIKDVVEAQGGTYIEASASSARQEQFMLEQDCSFGGGYSNHIFFRDNHPGYDDGIYAGLRIHEMLSHTNKTLHDMVKKLPRYQNSVEIRQYMAESKKKAFIKNVKNYCENKKYDICDIEGVKAYKKNGSWALVRASNTGPYITVRFEAKTKKDLLKIQKEFLAILDIEIK